MFRRPPASASVCASSSSLLCPLWTKLTPVPGSPAPSPRSGHAMTYLPPTHSLLVFGGADGQVFYHDLFVLPLGPSPLSSTPPPALEWQHLAVSHRPCPVDACPISDAGGGRDYHTMHYVASSSSDDDDEKGGHVLRVLVFGNRVTVAEGPGSSSSSTENMAQTFTTATFRVELVRVHQASRVAEWDTQWLDATSAWKPRARHAHSSVVVQRDRVYIFGGTDAMSSVYFNDFFYYDATRHEWHDLAREITGPVPPPRAFAGLTASDDGRTLFLFGGTDGTHEFGTLFLYHVDQCRWDSLRGATRGERPLCRINHSLTFVAPHHVVHFGGRRRHVRQNQVFVYNVATRTWREVDGGGQKDRPDDTEAHEPPRGRTAHATVRLPSPDAADAVQELIVFGGYAGSHQWLDDLYVVSLGPRELVEDPATCSTRTQSHKEGATPRVEAAGPSVPLRLSMDNEEDQAWEAGAVDTQERPFTDLGVLSDITYQKRQQAVPAAPAPRTNEDNSTRKKRQRSREDVDETRESGRGSSPPPSQAALGKIQTSLVHLCEQQPRVDETLARILSLLSRDDTTRAQDELQLHTLLRRHMDEHRASLEAATRRNEALAQRLAQSEAARASLHETLVARDTELAVYKQKLHAIVAPLTERIEAMESSHRHHCTMSRVMESKLSAVDDFLDDLRNARGEDTEPDERSPEERQGYVDECLHVREGKGWRSRAFDCVVLDHPSPAY
ncbi:hypothetical protein PsorP6_007084 [Peronosclerospora sorghi]|uniref:Uncharacterized protein n=1 Tax=Peronosclerospora sorghi TaxID=230839 RepID=A0ACC0W7I3_9STRA|nr:hypothetical protein PsorP6_007084 [Peronosclerospora sorghi]